jgi:thioredoxin-related protein
MKKLLTALFACLAAFQLVAADAKLEWKKDLLKAKEQAKQENKLILLDFTGSDWCGWCIKLHHDTFSKQEWADYAKKNLVLVEVDFPHTKEQPESLKNANAALQSKYSVNGFPTIIVLKPDGTVVWKKEGYLSGGPKAMIDEIENAKKKA